MGFRKGDVTQPVFSNPAPQVHGKLDGCCSTPMGEPEVYSRVLPVPWQEFEIGNQQNLLT